MQFPVEAGDLDRGSVVWQPNILLGPDFNDFAYHFIIVEKRVAGVGCRVSVDVGRLNVNTFARDSWLLRN